jgi:phage protein D
MAVATTAPGTRFYAPQARLVDADTNQVVGQSTGTSTPNPADIDLVSATVTLLINNVCQLQVVLDNQRNKGGLPVFPPWKYNSLAQIHFGQRLRLDIRYGGDPWHKMILARVTDLQFGFPSSGAAQLTIIGEDLLSLLKTKSDKEKRYADRKEDFVVRDVLVRSKAKDLGLDFVGIEPSDDPLKGPLLAWPELEPLRSVSQAKETTYLQFLQGIAERMDFELFVDFAERLLLDSQAPPKDANKVMLHFEPARSLVTPDQAIDLRWGTNLVDFTPKFKVWEQLTGVKVAGTKHGTRKRHTQTIRVDDAVIKQDLKQDLEYTLPAAAPGDIVELLDAGEARSRFFGDEGAATENTPSISTSNLDAARTRLQGIATLRNSLRELLTAEGSTFGFPDLRPGVYVRIGGLYPPFDGLYYVTQTVHSFDTNGYRTRFSLRRPGMLDPDKYPAKEAST